jgi:hypothetical protein
VNVQASETLRKASERERKASEAAAYMFKLAKRERERKL